MADHLAEIRVGINVGLQNEGWVLDPFLREELFGEMTDEQVVEAVQGAVREAWLKILIAKRTAAAQIEALLDQHIQETQ